MKWFQHQSKAHNDAKLQKVLMKYGFEGYGLYWYCIESICQDLEPKLTFQLDQDSEILGHVGKMDSRNVEEAMMYMVRLGLFTEAQGVIFCRTILHYLGDNITRNPDLKAMIKQAKTARLSQTVSDSMRLSQREERRGDERKGKEKNKTKRFTPPSVDEVAEYCASRGNTIDPSTFVDHYEANGWMRGTNKIKDWKACVRTWEKKQKPSDDRRELVI